MSFPIYYSVVPNFCVESLAPIDVNPWDGYKWYQSHPSSDVMDASPYYPVVYRPPDPPPLSSHGNSPVVTFNPYSSPSHLLHDASSDKGNQWKETLTKIMAILDRMQERCAVRSIVDDKTIQDEVVIGDGSRLGETVVEDEDNLQVDVLKSGRAVVGTVEGNDQADTSKLVKEAIEVQGKLIVDAVAVEPQVFDKSPVRNSDLVVENVCEDELNNNVDDSVVLNIFSKSQNSSSVLEYVEVFIDNISQVEIAFGRKFQDELLCYYFVVGLNEEIREALEIWSPKTLQGAIDRAKFQESLLKERLLVETMEMKSGKGLHELESQVEIRSDTSNSVKDLSSRINRGKNQIIAEQIHSMVFKEAGDIAEIFINNTDKIVIDRNDSQRQTTKEVSDSDDMYMMWIITKPTTGTIAHDLGKFEIASDKNVLIFDPGGYTHNWQPTCVFNMPKKIIKKEVNPEEAFIVGVILASCHIGELKKLIKSSSIPRNSKCRYSLSYSCALVREVIVAKVEELRGRTAGKIMTLAVDALYIFEGISLNFLAMEQLLMELFNVREKGFLVQIVYSAYLHESLERKWEGQIKDLKLNSNGGEQKGSPLVICFGELLIDLVPTVGGVSLAEAPAFQKALGGAPANVVVGISRLGGSSAFVGKVGNDEFGYMLADILKKNKVNNSGMRFDPTARTALAFVTLRSDGEREFLFFRHPSVDMLLHESELDRDLIKHAKVFHYGSISLVEEPCRSAHLATMAIAKESGSILSYDPNLRLPLWPSADASRKGIMSIWNKADIIKISEDEISFLTGGAAGCRYYTKHLKGRVAGIEVKHVDTTGAGDSFVAGLLYCFTSDMNLYPDEKKLRDVLLFANALAWYWTVTILVFDPGGY